MTVSLKHTKVTTKPDGSDNTLVQPSDWNAEHTLTQATNRLLGRTTAGVGATEEITVGGGLTLGSGALAADVTSVAGRTGAVTLSVTDVTNAVNKTGDTITGNTVISVNTSGDALRITQTGAGNALVVEDSANPDSTPFVVDTSGNVVVGYSSPVSIGGQTPAFQIHGGTLGQPEASVAKWQVNNTGPWFKLAKSRSTTIGTFSSTISGDVLGTFSWNGDDGTAFIQAASIAAAVDGTPGTNDMPGRLVFSTTASGASTPTERMRITSDGRLVAGSGATSGSAATQFTMGGTLVSALNVTRAFSNIGTAPTTSTTAISSYYSQPSTADGIAAATLLHFVSTQGTITGGTRTTPTNQYGYFADASLTGATSNFGFYGNIADGTGRWNFYANGTAPNYFGGRVGIGTTAPQTIGASGGMSLLVESAGGANTSTSGIVRNSADVGSGVLRFGKSRGTAINAVTSVASGDGLGQIDFYGADGTSYVAAASIAAAVDGTPGTNDMPGRLVFSTTLDGASTPTERMRIDNAGRIAVGATTSTTVSALFSRAITGGTFAAGVYANPVVQSDVTTNASYFETLGATAATSFTAGQLRHFSATQGTIGLGSTVTNQYGFIANSSLTGATNNFGFYSSIADGTGRWNFYANGTAPNYFGGNVGIATTTPTAKLQVGVQDSVRLDVSGSTSFIRLGSVLTGEGTSELSYTRSTGEMAVSFGNTGSALTQRYSFNTNGHTRIIADTTSDALRITQTGTGNALLVEDEANPDATPFIINNDGVVVAGHTSFDANWFSGGNVPRVWSVTNSANTGGFGAINYSGSSGLSLFRANGGVIGTEGAVAAGDTLGVISFGGYDGVYGGAYLAAGIYTQIDGTPGTGSMPGRIIFATTPSGSSSSVERMRIDNAGRVAIGAAISTGVTLRVGRTADAAAYYDFQAASAANASTTTTKTHYYSVASSSSNSGVPYTVASLTHYQATAVAFNADTTVTNQYGFLASNPLTGATNNYAFYGNISSGTGRWNFYANGTADNYFAGNVGIGLATPAVALDVGGQASPQIRALSTTNAVDTRVLSLGGSSVGIVGTYSNHSLLFYTNAAERMRVTNSGSVFVGTAQLGADTQFAVTGTLLSAASSSYANRVIATVPSTSTAGGVAYETSLSTQAASFTVGDMRHFSAAQGTIGLGSTVTTQIGYIAGASITGATNNYGFYGNIPSGTGRYNFYANGTADNYFAGNTGIFQTAPNTYLCVGPGSSATAAPTYTGFVRIGSQPSQSLNSNGGLEFVSAASGSGYGWRVAAPDLGSGDTPFVIQSRSASSTWTERLRIDATGRVGIGVNPTTNTSLFIVSGTKATDAFSSAITTTVTFGDGVTNRADSFLSYPSVNNTTGTVGTLNHFAAFQNTLTTAVTTQIGLNAGNSLIGATNNYGIHSAIPSGTGRYNVYITGTAANWFSGDVLVFGAGGLGYTTGSGGAVTQATSRTTGVTINKTNGAITLVSAAGSTTYTTFTVTNSTVAATDVVVMSQKSGANKYIVLVTAVAAGSFDVTFATTGGTATEQPVFNFAVIKAVTA